MKHYFTQSVSFVWVSRTYIQETQVHSGTLLTFVTMTLNIPNFEVLKVLQYPPYISTDLLKKKWIHWGQESAEVYFFVHVINQCQCLSSNDVINHFKEFKFLNPGDSQIVSCFYRANIYLCIILPQPLKLYCWAWSVPVNALIWMTDCPQWPGWTVASACPTIQMQSESVRMHKITKKLLLL